MKEIKIIIPGNAINKKSTHKMSLYMKDKHGRRIPRKFPVYYYSEAWKKWGQKAIVVCNRYKALHPEIAFPITERMNLKVLFYMDKIIKIDLSAMYEGIQDVLAGNAGVGKLEPSIYQIIEDDSIRFIGSHDGSRVFYDKINPRTEVYLTEFKVDQC